LLFLLSLLSKAMAASLPVILILTDYFLGREINRKAILEKLPFFLLAIIFGTVAIMAQRSQGAANVVDFTLPERILFACYGFITYIYKLIIPVKLSAYYPYPVNSGESIPVQFYAYLAVFIGLCAAIFYSLRFTKKIIFGFGFFAISIFLVLQLFPVGSAVMADRYSYIPSIGIFYLAGEGINLLWRRKTKIFAFLVIGIVTVLFSIKTYERSKVWKNDLTLWNDVISKYQNSPLPYNNRGNYLLSQEEYKKAIDDFNKALALDPENDYAYNLRGMAFMNQGKFSEAIDDFNKVIELDSGNAIAYVSRGWVHMNEGRNEEAINDFNRGIELDPDYATAYNDRGIYYYKQERYDEAKKDFDKAIALDPGYAEAYFDRANVSMQEKRYREAISFYTRAIETKDNFAQAYYNRGIAEFYSGRKNAACRDLRQAASLGYPAAEDALAQICK
jgi:Flp pilus assembly protein TadD